jgi:hypothetical protein
MAEGRDLPGRRRALRDDVGRLAADVGRAVVAEAVGLPVESGLRAARDALTRWAGLLGEPLPPPP